MSRRSPASTASRSRTPPSATTRIRNARSAVSSGMTSAFPSIATTKPSGDAVGSDVEQLNATFGRPGAVSFARHELGGIVAHLVTAQATATVAIHGAHVL